MALILNGDRVDGTGVDRATDWHNHWSADCLHYPDGDLTEKLMSSDCLGYWKGVREWKRAQQKRRQQDRKL